MTMNDEYKLNEFSKDLELFGIDVKDDVELDALMMAVIGGHAEIVDLLLKNGADAKWGSEELKTPLALACHLGRIDVVKALLDFHIDEGFKLQCNSERCALIFAISRRHNDIVDLLMSYKKKGHH